MDSLLGSGLSAVMFITGLIAIGLALNDPLDAVEARQDAGSAVDFDKYLAKHKREVCRDL
jgi:hypothetical protein